MNPPSNKAILLTALSLLLAGCPAVSPDDGDNGSDVPVGVEIAVPNEGAAHVPVGEQVVYLSNPPASGSHWSAAGVAPVAGGVYETTLDEEQWVHNLEHGYVVVLFDCADDCDEAFLAELTDLFLDAPQSSVFGTTKLVIAPYDGLPHLLTAIAWDRQLHLEQFDQDVLLDFYETYLDQGPELAP